MNDPTHAEALRTKILGGTAVLLVGIAIGVIVHVLRTPEEVVAPELPPSLGIKLTQTATPAPPAPEPEPDVGDTADVTATGRGCGGAPPEHTGLLTYDDPDVALPFLVYVPRGYDPSVRHSVILLFHDAGDTPELLVQDGRFGQLADRENVILVAPRDEEVFDGTGLYMRVWEASESIDDIPKILSNVQEEFCVDPARIYAVGQAAGGYAVEHLMCAMPLAGAATHAHIKVPADPSCEPKDPTPYLAMWGAKDPFAPVDKETNCIGVRKLSWAASTERWRNYNRTRGRATPWPADEPVTCLQWAGDATFMRCSLDAGGREWPWARPRIWSKLLTQCESKPAAFDGARLIWRFFEEVTLEAPDEPSN